MILYVIITAFLASVVAYAIAYFTARANTTGDLTFANLEISLMSAGETLTDAKFQSKYLTGIVPEDTLNFSTISVKNTGEADVYCLIKLNIDITKTDGSVKNIIKWYNLDAVEVSYINMPANTASASKIATGADQSTSLKYTFEGNVYDNSYKNASAKITLAAYGIQYDNIPTDSTYPTTGLYASYMIVTTEGSADQVERVTVTLNVDGNTVSIQSEQDVTL